MTESSTIMVRYSGCSMWPLFQEGDLLECEQSPLERIRAGDCVVFRTGDGGQAVHRVVHAGRQLRTRGDALPADDHTPVGAEHFLGKVVRRHRGGNMSRVFGGWRGLLAFRFYHLAGRLDPERRARGGALARKVRRAVGLLPLGGWLKGEVRTVLRPGREPVVVWQLGKWTVGRLETADGEWRLYWPWRCLLQPPQRQGQS